MRKEYDFSKSVKNPYLKKAKKQVTIRLDEQTIAYFKAMSQQNGIPYQNLINLYLRECALAGKKVAINWG
ncbi:MAG: BrnA antitoxin family protein [Gammaproteobacteria bacterium]